MGARACVLACVCACVRLCAFFVGGVYAVWRPVAVCCRRVQVVWCSRWWAVWCHTSFPLVVVLASFLFVCLSLSRRCAVGVCRYVYRYVVLVFPPLLAPLSRLSYLLV